MPNKKTNTADTPALLCSVNNHIEAEILESLLRADNIPVMKQWRNGGDVLMIYMAMSSTGADLYVPSKLLPRARQLLDSHVQVKRAAETADDRAYKEEKEYERQTKARLVIWLAFFLPALAGILGWIAVFLE